MGATKKSVVLMKIESTPGVDAIPTAALDAIKVQNIVPPTPANPKMYQQSPHKPTFGMGKSLYGGTLYTFGFDVLIHGSGAVDVAPEFGPAMQACGFDESITPTTGPVVYARLSTGIPTVTCYFYDDGKLWKFVGVRGNNPFSGVGGEPGILTFTFTGHYVSDEDAALPDPTFDNIEAPTITGAGFLMDGYAAKISTLTIDPANVMAMPTDWNASDAFGEVEIVDCDPNGTMDPLEVLKATRDFAADWRAGTVMAMTTGVIGSVAGNRWQLDMPGVSDRSVGLADREGLRSNQITFGAAESAGDDAMTYTFT